MCKRPELEHRSKNVTALPNCPRCGCIEKDGFRAKKVTVSENGIVCQATACPCCGYEFSIPVMSNMAGAYGKS